MSKLVDEQHLFLFTHNIYQLYLFSVLCLFVFIAKITKEVGLMLWPLISAVQEREERIWKELFYFIFFVLSEERYIV